ncbi:MAG TPA: hypothetical protein VF771_04685 [Longimicrobiaceae bacterium]
MYRHCIYCSADLGANEALEAFPVGRTVAFDAAKGRLWAVCPKCARWNLAPLEERWETVEDAERLFTDARLRAQSENIGLAKLRDGTKLVRIGAALPGELAAWRYGSEMRRRHRWFWPSMALIVGSGFLHFLPFLAFAPGVYFAVTQHRNARRRVLVVPADESPTGAPLELRGLNVAGAVVRPGIERGEFRVEVPLEGLWDRTFRARERHPVAVVHGDTARRLVERAMLLVNRFGGSRKEVDQAVAQLAARESAAALLEDVTRHGARLGVRMVSGSHSTHGGAPLDGARALAFEMALHDETERRALHGELKLLESAWREAEKLAAIADRLAGPALPGEMATGG